MKAVWRLDHRAVWHSPKNRVLALLWLVLGLGFWFSATSLKVGDLQTELKANHHAMMVSIAQVESMIVPVSGPKHDTAVALNRQSAAYGRAYMSFVLGDDAGTKRGIIALARLQIKGARGGYPGLQGATLPSEAAATRTLLTTQWRQAHGRPLPPRLGDAASTLAAFWPVLLALLPALAVAVTCDAWLMMSEHRSLTAALPVSWMGQAATKVLTRLGLVWLATLVSLVAAGAVGAAVGDLGPLDDAAAVALGGQLTVVPLWAALLLVLLATALTTGFIASAMLVVNVLTRNVYLSALLGAGCVALPWLAPGLVRTLWWLPLAGLAPGRVLDGTLQAQAGNLALCASGSAVCLGVWTLVMLVAFRRLAAHQQG